MSISARVIADSISTDGHRLTTFILTYPRFVHAEFMTHRTFSRNAASSRAIPSRKIRAAVRQDMASPVFWGANQKGMQAQQELSGWKLKLAKLGWKLGAYLMLALSWCLEKAGLHKQIANRILEPWFNITVICTATDWGNFYNLRNHEKAQPEIQALARAMLEAHNASIPKLLKSGEWHLPFVEDSELAAVGLQQALKFSVARCARISYLNHEGRRSSPEEDQGLYNKLLAEDPKHASPAEHQATPLAGRHGNFNGWVQHRKFIENETLSFYPGLLLR